MSTRALFLMGLVLAIPAQLFAQAADRFIPAYKTSTAPTIDGKIDPGEWDAAGPPIFVNQDSPNVGLGTGGIPEDVYGGDEDLSYSFRVMWEEPWMVYFLLEITDDIAMEEDPANLWERDQVELFLDGDDLFGSEDDVTFQWWDNAEPFGKFGVSRYTTYEGHGELLTDDQDGIYVDDEITFVNAAAVAGETGENANYVVEYAISIEPMYLLGTFDEDTVTSEAAKIVAENTIIKAQIALSDDDNYLVTNDDGTTVERSHTLSYLGLTDWRRSSEFADLTFVGEYTGGIEGDFNGNGELDLGDIDLLTTQSAGMQNPLPYDLNGDELVNDGDIRVWVKDLYNSWIGDANLDGEFNSGDLVSVLQAGTYEVDTDSVWSTGDFNGDGRTNTSDLVAALSDGGYELGPRAAVAAVPEPASAVLLLFGTLLLVRRRNG